MITFWIRWEMHAMATAPQQLRHVRTHSRQPLGRVVKGHAIAADVAAAAAAKPPPDGLMAARGVSVSRGTLLLATEPRGSRPCLPTVRGPA